MKERLFGLTNGEGNHGEDVKELYYYLDATPTHSYLKMLYKYPQREFPYDWLVKENGRRSKQDPEFELIDTDAFHEERYFDVFVEYSKLPRDILIRSRPVADRKPRRFISSPAGFKPWSGVTRAAFQLLSDRTVRNTPDLGYPLHRTPRASFFGERDNVRASGCTTPRVFKARSEF